MLKHWESKLLGLVMKNPKEFVNRSCNDWAFPDFMTLEDREEFLLKYEYYNDDGEQIREDYGHTQDPNRAFLDKVNKNITYNFMIPTYLRHRLEEEGIACLV